jgi:hypothetical protein
MAKNLIIGGATNYGINQLKPWVLSAKEVSTHNTDIVLCCGNMTPETYSWLVGEGVILVEMKQVPNIPIHVLRFLSIYDYLKDNWENYEHVVTTDVKDVYFQADPFEDIKRFCENDYKLVIASECLKYKDEPWGDENLRQSYGMYVYEQFKENYIFNVGTFGGTSEYVKDMVFNIFTNAINRPIPICDQAVFNVLINTQPYKQIVARTVDWAAELGTIMDPSKIEYFRPNLVCDEPIFDGRYVRYGDIVYPIVHQYDRVPEIKKFVQKWYEQEDESQLFIYRT